MACFPLIWLDKAMRSKYLLRSELIGGSIVGLAELFLIAVVILRKCAEKNILLYFITTTRENENLTWLNKNYFS